MLSEQPDAGNRKRMLMGALPLSKQTYPGTCHADGRACKCRLTASDRARRQLLADVSHELMTPLTAMRGYLETLTMPEMQIDSPPSQRQLSAVIQSTGAASR